MRVDRGRGARVRRGEQGIRVVLGDSAVDAYRAWGQVDARGRMFQMDLLRRAASGRLAELFGSVAVQADRAQRLLPLVAVAERALVLLPTGQRALLDAYAEGVNDGLRRGRWTLEHLLLRVRPEPWCATDTLLIMLHMMQQLSLDVECQRMERVLAATVPNGVRRFLLPRGDLFSEQPDHGPGIPVAELGAMVRAASGLPLRQVVEVMPTGASNCWAVGPCRTATGRAILANDMHLALTVPNVFHRVDVTYTGGRGLGFAIPGVPIIASGSNGRVAWGMANIPADCTRLLRVTDDTVPHIRNESIAVRKSMPITATFEDTPDGPVLNEPVLGERVALQWTGLWPDALDLGWTGLLEAGDVEEARAVAHRSGGPPVAMVFADERGSILRTVSGRFPSREGNRLSRPFVSPGLLPVTRDPANGVLIWTNDPPRVAGGEVVGHNHPASYRRYRLEEVLTGRHTWTEADMHAVQLDARAGFYDFYLDLAREALTHPRLGGFASVRAVLSTWDGYCDAESTGVALLVEYRRQLVEHLISYLLRACVQADPSFRYSWRNPEPVLRGLLTDRPPGLVPASPGVECWHDYLADRLAAAADRLNTDTGRPVETTRWRDYLSLPMRHPLGSLWPLRWLNLASLSPSGGLESVAAHGPGRGPVQRLVVSPGGEEDGIAQMPGGQSGHPWSPHYRDHHRSWRRGTPLPLTTSVSRRRAAASPHGK